MRSKGHDWQAHQGRKLPLLKHTVASEIDWQEWTEGLLGGPVVKTLPSNAGGQSSIPGCEAKMSHAYGQKKKKKKNPKHKTEAVL